MGDFSSRPESERILVTSALLYANGPLHLGHLAGAFLPADCFSRFHRMQQNDVLFISGSDEYGVAITLGAEIEGHSPQEHVDIYHERNQQTFSQLGISFDYYGRTTTRKHHELVCDFFRELHAKGLVEERECEQLFCEAEGRFCTDRYVKGICPHCHFLEARGDECPRCGETFDATELLEPKSKLTDSPLTLRKSNHWFLRCDLFRDHLMKWIQKKNWKSSVVEFAKRYARDLRPRAITRDLHWGVPVPEEFSENKVFYVWFDAPIGYISMTQEWATFIGKEDDWKKFWLGSSTKHVEFIGKDNIPFHALFFPIMLKGQSKEYTMVDTLAANEFLSFEGHPFSKSEEKHPQVEDLLGVLSSDQIRYALLANAPETSDVNFSFEELQSRCNADLLGKYGNLANRILVFHQARIGEEVVQPDLIDQDWDFIHQLRHLASKVAHFFSTCCMRKACREIMEIASLGNAYLDQQKPWKNQDRMPTVLYASLECLKVLACVSSPVIPEAAQQLWNMLGFKSSLETGDWHEITHTLISPGQRLTTAYVLFRHINDDMLEPLKGK